MKKIRRKSSQDQEPGSPVLPPSPIVPPPPLEWEDRAQCLGPILRYSSVPMVVTCDRSHLPAMKHVNFDFSQPLLLHTRRTVRKVVASNVVHVQQEGGKRLKEVGDRLLIPEDYKGWFAVLGSPNEVKPDRVIPHFRQVAQLALSKCGSFLIGGNEPLKAVQMVSSGAGGNNRAQPRLVYPGDVLRMGKLYVGESTLKVKKPSLFGGKKTVKKEEKFLLCTDDNDRELYLPVESRGTFYMLTTEGYGSPKIPIMRMPDICTHFRFPCVVRLLFGRVPSTPCSFTGTLVLQDSHMESSVIGCTMMNLRNILLDIPIDSDLRFFVARNTRELLSSHAYKNASDLCKDKASTYMRNMKVAYFVNDEERSDLTDAQEAEGNGDELSPVSENVDSFCKISRSRPSIVEDHELFCPPETTSKSPVVPSPMPCQKKSKISISNSETIQCGDSATISSTSPEVLRKDTTFDLPEPPESLSVKISKSSSVLTVESKPFPQIAAPIQHSNALPTSGYMTMEETVGQRSVTMGSVGNSRTPPPTPPKPRKHTPLRHNQSEGGVYMQAWDGEVQITPAESDGEKDSDNPPTPGLRPRGLDVPRSAHRMSSIALADTYLTLPVFKGAENTSSALVNDSLTLYENTGADSNTGFASTLKSNHEATNQSEKSVYDTPASLPLSKKQPKNTSLVDEQPYEIMKSVTKTKHSSEQVLLSDQKPPTPPPKSNLQSSQSLTSDASPPRIKPLPPVPVISAVTDSSGIVFENASWMFSDTSSMQSCEYASRWLSSHHQATSQDMSDPTYVHMHREIFTYYEGYDPNNQRAPEDKDSAENTTVTDIKCSSFDQSIEQSEAELVSSTEESGANYANVQNLRPCKGKLSSSNSFSDTSDDNHARFLDKIVNPPTTFGYVKPPPPRPVPAKKPPPVPKKPTTDRRVGRAEPVDVRTPFESGSNGNSKTRPSLPPAPCRSSDSVTVGYLHPYAEGTGANTVDCGAVFEDSTNSLSFSQTRVNSFCSDSSHQSSEDDLPLGATFANFRSHNMSDSGCALESVAEERTKNGSGNSYMSSLSVADLGDALKNVGLMKETVDILRKEKVDGRLLVSLDEGELRETLPGIKKLDIKKILMFVNGWRPLE